MQPNEQIESAQVDMVNENQKLHQLLDQTLTTIECLLEESFSRRFPECCGHYQGNECCGNPVEAWDSSDERILDKLSPLQRTLSRGLHDVVSARIVGD